MGCFRSLRNDNTVGGHIRSRHTQHNLPGPQGRSAYVHACRRRHLSRTHHCRDSDLRGALSDQQKGRHIVCDNAEGTLLRTGRSWHTRYDLRGDEIRCRQLRACIREYRKGIPQVVHRGSACHTCLGAVLSRGVRDHTAGDRKRRRRREVSRKDGRAYSSPFVRLLCASPRHPRRSYAVEGIHKIRQPGGGSAVPRRVRRADRHGPLSVHTHRSHMRSHHDLERLHDGIVADTDGHGQSQHRAGCARKTASGLQDPDQRTEGLPDRFDSGAFPRQRTYRIADDVLGGRICHELDDHSVQSHQAQTQRAFSEPPVQHTGRSSRGYA